MSDRDDGGFWRRHVWQVIVTLVVAFLPMGYILSAGPVYRYCHKVYYQNPVDKQRIDFVLSIYGPVWWLVEDTALEKSFFKYVDSWIDPDDRRKRDQSLSIATQCH